MVDQINAAQQTPSYFNKTLAEVLPEAARQDIENSQRED
jgi:hypothetical protein